MVLSYQIADRRFSMFTLLIQMIKITKKSKWLELGPLLICSI